MQIARIGLDLAKYVFEIHGVDAHGKTVLRKTLRRHAVSAFFANLPPCLVGMEASNGAHFWAKALSDLGHDVRLISPQFVTPYVKSNKNDRNDAEAICEAVGRPNMRFAHAASGSRIYVSSCDLGPALAKPVAIRLERLPGGPDITGISARRPGWNRCEADIAKSP